MKKALAALALLAVPAQAQDAPVFHASDTWPVHHSAAGCTMDRAGETATGSGRLSVSYDAARGEVTLATTAAVESGLAHSGTLDMALVFLDNGAVKHDDEWGSRRFAYAESEGTYRFVAAFAGEKNVRQILADLANSRRLGLLVDGEVLFDHDLAGARTSLARLRDCAARSVASG